MNIKYEIDSKNKKTLIKCFETNYDATVNSNISIMSSPRLRNDDRFAVAASLMLSDVISGELILDTDFGCSSYIATAIQSFFSPVNVIVSPQSLTPIKQPIGSYTAYMSLDESLDCNIDRSDKFGMSLKFVMGGAGSLYSENSAVIGVNFSSNIDNPTDEIHSVLRHIGAALIFADDLQIAAIKLDGNFTSKQSVIILKKAQKLLAAVHLKLIFNHFDKR